MNNNEQNQFIDGLLYEQLVINGAMNLKAHLKTVNDLNVFPIPDGDTGDNMFMTINGGLNSIKTCTENSIGKKASALADGMLLNARGNSGVILSQLFAGIADGLKGRDEVSVKEFGVALSAGVKRAYSSVAQPVEGTMLTVARESAEYAQGIADGTMLGNFLKEFVVRVSRSLDHTPDLLPTLKEAGVIDSGGAGLLYIAEGMEAAAEGKEIAATDDVAVTNVEIDFSAFNEDSEMLFGYCTEVLFQLSRAKTDVENFPINDLIAFLESIGDSVVAFVTGTVVKLHVHTFTPYKVLEYCQRYGEFLTVKIENMTLQHNSAAKEEEKEEERFKVNKARKKFALVTVATGKGLIDTFYEFGADEVIDGGQGKNPSIERFTKAYDRVNADYIFVLPNNSNIIMAAKQSAELYKNSTVLVVETKDIGQAYSVLSMLDYGQDDPDAIYAQMKEDMQSSETGMITSSVREANLNGVEIGKGEYIGFTGKTMLVCKKEKVDAFMALTEKLSAGEKSFMIVSYGAGITTEEKNKTEEFIAEKYPDLEYYAIDGGQEVYDYIIILE